MTTTKHDPATQEWLDSRAVLLEISQRINSALRDRPRWADGGREAYQRTVMAPLIEERTTARQAMERARLTMLQARKAEAQQALRAGQP